MKRIVWERDGGQCTNRSADRMRCPERDQLEFHHDDPYTLNGDGSPENVRLLCPQHNAYFAEKDYGKPKWTSTVSASHGPHTVFWESPDRLMRRWHPRTR